MPAFYKESQKFTQLWLWLVMMLSTVPAIVVFFYGFVKQLIFGIPWGNHPMSNVTLALSSLFVWAICGGVLMMISISVLHLEIRDKAVFFRFPIFSPRTKRIGMDELTSWQIIRFSPMDYGGYGVRHTLKKKTAYLVKGRNAIELKLKNGKTFIIGTQNSDRAGQALQKEWDRYINKS